MQKHRSYIYNNRIEINEKSSEIKFKKIVFKTTDHFIVKFLCTQFLQFAKFLFNPLNMSNKDY